MTPPQVQVRSGLPVIQEEGFQQPSSGSEWADEGSEGEDVVGGTDDVPDDAASDQVSAMVPRSLFTVSTVYSDIGYSDTVSSLLLLL